jgi:hypothetical protein
VFGTEGIPWRPVFDEFWEKICDTLAPGGLEHSADLTQGNTLLEASACPSSIHSKSLMPLSATPYVFNRPLAELNVVRRLAVVPLYFPPVMQLGESGEQVVHASDRQAGADQTSAPFKPTPNLHWIRVFTLVTLPPETQKIGAVIFISQSGQLARHKQRVVALEVPGLQNLRKQRKWLIAPLRWILPPVALSLQGVDMIATIL